MPKTVTFGPDKTFDLQVSAIDTFMGEKLANPIVYNGEATQYLSKDEAIAAGEWPDNLDVFTLKSVNSRMLASAKSAAYQGATKAEKAKYDTSPAKARKDFIDSVLKSPQINGDVNKANALADSMGF